MSKESTTENEKQEKKRRKITKDIEKKNDNVISSLVQHNHLKTYLFSFKGTRDFDRHLLAMIPSNDDSNIFVITPVN